MSALRIMTFNVQMLPGIATTLQGQSDRAKAIANDVADAIMSLPAAEQPDVIAINEAFNEEGRNTLKARLSVAWPNVIGKIFDGLLKEDSGLMLFSRLPLLPVNGGKYHEHIFSSKADDDSMASKAVGIVQVGTPLDKTTIAFAHLQASYKSEDEYSDIRAQQLDAIYDAIKEVIQDDGLHGRVVIMGDLNIRGDKDAVSGEWGKVFQAGGTRLCGPYLDGWKEFMHAPGMDGVDQGITHVDLDNPSQRQRLDYMCFCKRGAADILIVPQHMRIRLRKNSDHFALEGVVHQLSKHCTPSDAIDGLGVVPNSGGTPGLPTSVRQIEVNFKFEGSYQWVFVRKPGTYTIHKSDGFSIETYLVSNMSHPVTRLDFLDKRWLPGGLEAGFRQHQIDPRGETFLCREPFFILVRGASDFTGGGFVWLTEHQGESEVTAIALRLFDQVETSFPPIQMLGEHDVCWFRADMPATLQGQLRSEEFVVDNQIGGSVSVEVVNAANKQVAPPVSGAARGLSTNVSVVGGERLFVKVKRANRLLTGFTVEWRSPVSYLDLDDPITLFINDETGVDIGGADEPELELNIDNLGGPAIFRGTWDDADTDEWWLGLGEAIVSKLNSIMPGVRRIGFLQGIWLTYLEPDVNAQGVPSESISPLTPGEPDRVLRTINLRVPDVVSDGRYTFTCTITRFP